MKNLSVIIPCFNEENTILELISRVLEQENVGQVIIVNDCSTDKTAELLKTVIDERCLVINQEINRGKGAAVSRGFSKANLEYCVIQDADLEYNPTDYAALLDPLIRGLGDAVFGSRFVSSGSRRALYFWHRMGNNFLTLLSNMFTNIDLTDMETCYKMMKTEYAKLLDIEEPRFGIEPEITAKLAAMRLRIFEVPISYNGRTYGEGKKITWKDGFSAIRCIFKYSMPKKKRQILMRKIRSEL
jgi:glycosyltransferase involved in cell wall biosynthesis